MSESNIVPFGKYKGQPIEVLAQDKQYAEWLSSQPWFREKFSNINTIIINNFREASETPEHNKLQAKFLDEHFLVSLSNHILKHIILKNAHTFTEDKTGKETRYVYLTGTNWHKYESGDIHYVELSKFDQPYSIELFKPIFEFRNIDVIIGFRIVFEKNDNEHIERIELKPSIGDDYPSILRQMVSNKSDCLIAESFAASGANINQVRNIFASRNKQVLLISDFTTA